MTKVLIMDGSSAADRTAERVVTALKYEILSFGCDVDHLVLRDMQIGDCAGDFLCWIRSPGMCVVDNDNRTIARSVVNCDLVIFLTPVTFGGYGSTLKRAVDRLTQINLPFFVETDGEIHHQPRYHHYPKLLAIGWMDVAQENEEAIFHTLVQRNAINLHFQNAVSGIVDASQTEEEVASKMKAWMVEIQNGASTPSYELARISGSPFNGDFIQKALLLVGSPRGKMSTSQALGGYLFEQLRAHNLPTGQVFLYPALKSPEGIQSLLEAVEAHDLIVLGSPLYIDSLPGPVMQALEVIAAHFAGKPERHALAVMINSGFPEAKQSMTALAICEAFTYRAGFTWAGGLVLGGGAGVVNGTPLVDLGWRARSIRKALELTANCLASGEPVPNEAIKLMGKTRIPKLIFFVASRIGWLQRSRKYGVEKKLRQQPYLTD